MQRPPRQDDDTVNAAAIVLAAAASTNNTGRLHLRQRLDDDDHTSCAATEKTRWWSRLKARLACFRPHGHPQRIAAAASPEPAAASAEPAAGNSSSFFHYTGHARQPPAVAAFVVPPPSPASSAFTSEAPSPVLLLNANIISTYSSPTASIFAVGPYAGEPQLLVSPPAFSAGLTEPSTAPLTPPAEPSSSCSPHLLATTPSSPEVPFARFLWPSAAAADHQRRSGGGAEGLLFHAYPMQPGSPVLVSPGSTSSSPPSWAMQHPVLLDGGRVPVAEEGGDRGSGGGGGGGASTNDGEHEDDEVAKSGGEFVFGNNSDAAAGGEVAGGGSSLALRDATEQWPFHLAHG